MVEPNPKAAQVVSLRGNVKVTRDDWIAVANDVLISQGIDQVKILNLSERLDVSRSSFYWYFKSRQALLNALLDAWRTSNTQSFIDACDAPAETITEAVCNLFRCFVDPALFDPQLDFAIREWSRRSGPVRAVVDSADTDRLEAVARMFERHDYPPQEAEVRARILYYMQIGYYALELSEPLEKRLSLVRGYLLGFTGQDAADAEIEALGAYARAAQSRLALSSKGE
ncbi:MAG: TetR/AcrR family transcriptional regulator [Pseudomonadota bacterium]